MPLSIQQIRSKYPQYGDMTDEQLAASLHKKFYPDMSPDDFAAKIGVHIDEDTKQAIKSGMSWSDVAKSAASNVLPSAGQFASDIAQPFIHPVDTAQNLGNIGKGVLQKLGVMSGKDSEKYADAVGNFFMDRYGSVDAIKNTLANDPVGALADLSTVFGGAELSGVKAAGTVARAIDPLTVAGKAIKATGKVASEGVGGLLTGTGGKAIEEAASSGAKVITDPAQGQAFRANYAGKVDPSVVVQQAQDAVSNLIKERGTEYTEKLKKLGANKKALDFDEIDKAIQNATKIGQFEGKDLYPSLAATRNEIINRVEEWKGLPEVFRTPAGLDALKKYISDIRNDPANTDKFGRLTAQGIVVKKAEKAIVSTIAKQDPQYAKMMEGYSKASDIIENLQRELSLGRNANVDTGLRKLQSVLRNNVSTSYARRERLAEYLKDNGATTLLAALAGQQMSSIIPRGLAARVFAAGAAFMGLEHGEMAKHLGIAALSSPKLAGGLAHAGGIAASPLYAANKLIPGLNRGLGRSAFQIGRLPQQ